LARIAGLRKNGGVTSVPSFACFVIAATAASSLQASKIGRLGAGTP
jgi:hypothetical protein